MIHFNLNIDLFYDYELKQNSELKAIACIEYPVLHIIAKTLESTEEEYDELDRFIVNTAYKHNGFSIRQFGELTGLSPDVFESRAKELVKQEYIVFVDEIISLNDKGFEFLNNPSFEREIEKTRSFLLDGITHEPLRSYFYKDGKDNLLSEDERDSYGNKLFNPSIIHNPPSRNIQQLILGVPLEDRVHFNIPVGLKGIRDYDFVLMTYPVSIILSKTENGKPKKRLIDMNGFYADEDCVSHWQKALEQEINKVEILIEEKDVVRNETTAKKTHFKNNWSKARSADENRIFNVTKDKLSYFIQRLYNISSIQDQNVVVSNTEIKIKVDKNLFDSEGTDKKKLIESCLRKRDYYRQYEGTGVWLIFFDIVIVDDYIQSLVDLYELLQKETSVEDLLKKYDNDYKEVRQNLIAIERFDKLEELDIYLFVHARETGFKQQYKMLKNE
jgi:hypothetical protein